MKDEALCFEEVHFEMGRNKPRHFEANHADSIFKKVGKDIQKAAKAIEKATGAAAKDALKLATEAVKTLKTIGVDAGEAVTLAPIVMYIPLMKAELKAKGVANDGTPYDIVGKYYTHIIKKQNFEANHMDSPQFNFENFEKLNLIDDLVQIVKEILAFFVHKKGNDDVAAQQIHDAEAKAFDAAKGGKGDGADAEAGVKGNLFGKKFDIAAFIKSPKKLIPVVIIIIGAIVLIANMKKK